MTCKSARTLTRPSTRTSWPRVKIAVRAAMNSSSSACAASITAWVASCRTPGKRVHTKGPLPSQCSGRRPQVVGPNCCRGGRNRDPTPRCGALRPTSTPHVGLRSPFDQAGALHVPGADRVNLVTLPARARLERALVGLHNHCGMIVRPLRELLPWDAESRRLATLGARGVWPVQRNIDHVMPFERIRRRRGRASPLSAAASTSSRTPVASRPSNAASA